MLLGNDEKLLERLKSIRDNGTGRMLWFDPIDNGRYPPLVEKALHILNLKQVAYEIETSVMSKVSCTACRAGKGWLYANQKWVSWHMFLYFRSWTFTTLYSGWEKQRRDNQDYLHVLCESEDTKSESLRRNNQVVWGQCLRINCFNMYNLLYLQL